MLSSSARLALRAAKLATATSPSASLARRVHSTNAGDRSLNLDSEAVVAITSSQDGRTVTITFPDTAKQGGTATDAKVVVPLPDSSVYLVYSPPPNEFARKDDAPVIRRRRGRPALATKAAPAASPEDGPPSLSTCDEHGAEEQVVNATAMLQDHKGAAEEAAPKEDKGADTQEDAAGNATPASGSARPVVRRRGSASRSSNDVEGEAIAMKQADPVVHVHLHALLHNTSLHSVDYSHAKSWLSTLSGNEELNCWESPYIDDPATRPVCTKLVLEVDGVELRPISDARGVTAGQVLEALAAHWDSPVAADKESLTKYWPGPRRKVATYREELDGAEIKWAEMKSTEDGTVHLVAKKV